MTLDELKSIADIDMTVSMDKLDTDSISIAKLISKWVSFMVDVGKALKVREQELKEAKKQVVHYYLFESDFKPDKSSMSLYVETDDRYKLAECNYEDERQKLIFIENIVKGLQQRGYHIKNAIEYQKFINGIS